VKAEVQDMIEERLGGNTIERSALNQAAITALFDLINNVEIKHVMLACNLEEAKATTIADFK